MQYETSQLQIDMQNKKAVDNFSKWLRKEGFDLFLKSKFNKLTKETDSFISCLATDEKMDWGVYMEFE